MAPVHDLFGIDAITIADGVDRVEVVLSVAVEPVRFVRVR